MKKVLIVMNAANIKYGGGIIQIIINYYELLKNENDIVMDFAMNLAEGCQFSDYAVKNGSRFFQLPNKKEKLFLYIKELSKILSNNYDVIHVHGSSSTMCLELFIALTARVPMRIAHSHNSTCTYIAVAKLLKPILNKTYTHALACSKSAGGWLFGNSKFTILHNAIDINNYRFSEKIRYQYRKMLNINDKTLIVGHVGNFVDQKNHDFLIDIFYEVQKECNTILLLVGVGALQEKIKQKVEMLGITKKVLFMDFRDDVSNLMQAMDVFLFPSKWEGLPLVLIEAQASGLPCFVSNTVSFEIKMTEYIYMLELKSSASFWAKEVIKNIKVRYEADNDTAIKQIEACGYNIKKEAQCLKNIWLSK